MAAEPTNGKDSSKRHHEENKTLHEVYQERRLSKGRLSHSYPFISLGKRAGPFDIWNYGFPLSLSTERIPLIF